MKNKFKNWYLLPFVIILSLPVFVHGFVEIGPRYFLAFVITFLIPLLLISIFKIKPFWFVVVSLPILILAIMYDIMIIEYDSYVNINAWNSIINSNPAEASEFSSEIRSLTKAIVILQIVTYFFYFFYTFKAVSHRINIKYRLIFLGVLSFFMVDYFAKGATRVVFPFRSIKSLAYYYKVKKQEAKYYEIKKNAVFNAKRTTEYKKTTKETIVVLVGETLRRDHLEYYGYKKPTTPLIKNEDLLLFSDVISPANQTVNSLQRAFTLAEMLDENNYWKHPSFIRSFKEVGFKTFWVSTQLVYDKYINEVSFIAQECDSIINYNMETFDERIIEPYNGVLQEKAQKKLIFLHILGNHSTYENRFPESFTFFSKVKSNDKRVNIMHQYDDAVRYNDYVISQFLDKLKKQEGERTFIMFSDHGESLYDSKPTYFNHGSDKPAQSEFNIPFWIWFSDEFKNNHLNLVEQATNNKDKAIILSDLFHTLPSFFGIEFNMLRLNKNFLNNKYKPNLNRKVINGSSKLLDYNKLKKTIEKIDY